MIIWIDKQACRYKNERSTHFYDVSANSIVRIYCIYWNRNDFLRPGGLFVKSYRFLESFCKAGVFRQLISEIIGIFNSIKGITKKDRTRWDAIKFSKKFASGFDHFDYPDKKTNIFRYCFGLIAFVKSSDGTTVSCYRGIYSLNFKLEETMLSKHVPDKTQSFLWRLIKCTETETTETREIKMIKTKDQERFNNFLQFKALSMFKRKGILERISYKEWQI